MAKLLNYVGLAVAASLILAAPAHATGGTYDSLTGAVDWADAITAVVAVAALLAAVLVVRKGVRFVLGMIR